jgi:hypothetical protein
MTDVSSSCERVAQVVEVQRKADLAGARVVRSWREWGELCALASLGGCEGSCAHHGPKPAELTRISSRSLLLFLSRN